MFVGKKKKNNKKAPDFSEVFLVAGSSKMADQVSEDFHEIVA